MFKAHKLISTSLLCISISAIAQNPVPKVGNACPGSTYQSGDYCIPNKSTSEKVIIQKTGKHCPSGFDLSGDYCKRRVSSNVKVVPKHSGRPCPGGWRKDGDYCAVTGGETH